MMATTTVTAPRVGVAGILVRPDGRILLARRGHNPGRGRWAFPGGKVEFRERLNDALQREYYEETGIRVHVGDLAYVAEIIEGSSHYVVLDYLVDAENWIGQPMSDIDALEWVSAESWQHRPLAQGMDHCLNDERVRKLLGWDRL